MHIIKDNSNLMVGSRQVFLQRFFDKSSFSAKSKNFVICEQQACEMLKNVTIFKAAC